MEIHIRRYKSSDCLQIARLFYQTVHTVNAAHYSQRELDAWAPALPDIAAWDMSFLSHYTLVAGIDDRIVGFGDITADGYLDRLYVHAAYQHQKIASSIADGLESYAGIMHCSAITTEASMTAKPFFAQRRYQTVKKQTVIRHGVPLINFVMEKKL